MSCDYGSYDAIGEDTSQMSMKGLGTYPEESRLYLKTYIVNKKW